MKVRTRYGNADWEHPDLVRIVDTGKTDIRGIGWAKDGTLVTYHVTDDPSGMMAHIKARRQLMGRGRSSELGPGLYVSGNPDYWVNRATGKWDFLKRLTPEQLERLVGMIAEDVEKQRAHRRLSESEYEYARRDLRYVATGDYEPSVLVRFADQPYNVPFWRPDVLAKLRIQAGRKPGVLEVRLRGLFAEVKRSHPSHELLRLLRRGGIQGAFTRASMATNPELVVWDPRAIVSVKREELEA